MSCLDALGPFVTFAGILFVYGGTGERMTGHDLVTTQWVKCFCGPEFYRYVTIVTTKWDSFIDASFKEKWVRFTGLLDDPIVADLLKPAASDQNRRYHGGAVYHHGI